MGNFQNFLNLAVKAAFKAGKVLKKGFDLEKEIIFKRFADPVTLYDKESEKIIVDQILSNHPDHSILTEENLSRDVNKDYKWIIDPLDGTVNFTHKIPYISISIALEINQQVVLGVVYNPVLDEIYTAIQGAGAFMNKKRLSVSNISSIGKALVATGFPYERDGRIEELMKPMPAFLKDYQGYRRLGSATMDLVYVARGSFDGFYEENLKPWDTAAGKIIVEEAGGKLTDYSNNPYSVYQKTIIASNSLIHNQIVDLLKDVKKPD